MVLTVIAVLLAALVFERQSSIIDPAAAHAQGAQQGGMTNALEQRKQMIAELRQMNNRLERIESRMNAGLNVRVTDMPPLRLPADAND